MDPKLFEEKLSEVAQWQRVNEDKIHRRPDEVDPRHHNPQIEIVELFEKQFPCDWCERRTCSGRRTLQKSDDQWIFYCNSCRRYYDPETKKLLSNPNSITKPRGRPKKST